MNLRRAVQQALGQWDFTVSARGSRGKDQCANACRTYRGRQVDPDGCNSCLIRTVKSDAFASTCATKCSPTSGGGCACYTSRGDVIKCTGCTSTRVESVQQYNYGTSLYGYRC